MRVDIVYTRRGDEFPVTVDFSYNAPVIEAGGVDITELISSCVHQEIVEKAQQESISFHRSCLIENNEDIRRLFSE